MRIGIQELVVLQCLDLPRGIVGQVFDELLVLFTDVSQNIVGKIPLVFIVMAFLSVGPLVNGVSFHGQYFFKLPLDVFHDPAHIEPFQALLSFCLQLAKKIP